MHNWFAMETEAEAIRLDRERMAAADVRSAQVASGRWTQRLPHLSLAPLRALLTPPTTTRAPVCAARAFTG